ncbi:MAG: bifunctional UDP-N-acetylglucosamine diphosphorylase/glucosamine-1-phosphate N-acetyltransferase GlmU [Ruminiclostridium sp.]|nr:bifunctional UDP-N-acetylglucosamine diphosphorylase/glucosamine-1-phosphate N-acetyltransferase GlmU [Ruminiclostridium sp.]
MSCKAIVLAAGDGRRMKSAGQKVLRKVLGEPMLGWVLDILAEAGIAPEDTGVVVGSGADAVKEYLGSRAEYRIFTQSGRKGTAHAVMQAAELPEDGDNVLVMPGDMPFVNCSTIIASLNEHTHSGSDITVISAVLDDPADGGRVVRGGDGSLEAVAYPGDCTPGQLGITEIFTGLCWFRAEALKAALPKLSSDNSSGEYRLGDLAAAIRSNGGKAGVFRVSEPSIALGADDRSDLLRLNIIAKMAVIGKLMSDGVEFVSTDGIIIERGVRIGRDTVILPGTIIRGSAEIGEGCVIGPNSLIENCKIGNNVTLNNVQAYDSRVADRVKAGPFVQLRPGTVLHEGVKIGDFVEIKNSEIGVNTAVAHLTYLGDSDVGKGVNFGCGCVTANYDGVNKYRTTIGDYAFIGCNTNLIAPVEIGENAATGAGSTITSNVPADSLALERSKTRIIEHWEKNSQRKKKA